MAAAPQRHLDRIRREPRTGRRVPAGGGAHHAVDIGHLSTPAAHEVVVLVGAALEARGVPGQLDPAHQTDIDPGPQDVVHGLGRDGSAACRTPLPTWSPIA